RTSAGDLGDLLDNLVIVRQLDGVFRTHLARHLKREGAARDGNHMCAGETCQTRQQGAKESRADDGNVLSRLDAAAAEDVHGAGKWLARKRFVCERIRQ